MKYITNILILFLSVNCYAQSPEKIELLHADKLTSGPKNSDYWICTGNVSFSHNNTVMNCDYSHHYMKENKMIAYNNVSINKGDTLNVKGRKLVYDGNKNIAHLSGDVLLKDKHTQLNTDEVFFNLETNIAHYPSRGVIREKDMTLSSEKGIYNTKSHVFYFKKNVKVKSVNYSVETDTLNYNSIHKTTYFLGPSYIFSEENTIYCENGWYNTITNISLLINHSHIAIPIRFYIFKYFKVLIEILLPTTLCFFFCYSSVNIGAINSFCIFTSFYTKDIISITSYV